MKRRMKVVVVIPARYHSTRFEGKPLAKILGKPMIYYVYKSVEKCKGIDELVVATDDNRICEVVRGFGGRFILTSADHPTGTDRVAEAAVRLNADIVVNVQGDEPLVQPNMVLEAVKPLLSEDVDVSNLISKIVDLSDYVDVNVVKAAKDKSNFLMYLTRSAIPYPKTTQEFSVYKQIGLYAFKRRLLQKFVKMKQTPLELIEGIEFLRLLENGIKVRAVLTDYNAKSVDTLSDLKEVEKIISAKPLNSKA